ncbi:hypothetical protein AN644_04120 [Candidatus Epulonipiscium fishelsonii]|nr:hypothetical protein AN644_04120 [Epulopiscium sp. SCG-C06WGA-EpuloA1]
MLETFPKINYDYDKIKLQKIFENEKMKDFKDIAIQTPESIEVFGELKLAPLHEDRAYTMACFVSSIDGKIAYVDNPAGPMVARSNELDPDGASADFWVLNLMRTSVDAICIGGITMRKEPNGLVCLFDQKLEDARIANGKPRAPWVIVCSLTGEDIPFEDTMFLNQPIIINTSRKGLEVIKENCPHEYYVVGCFETDKDIDAKKIKEDFEANKGKVPVIVTGKKEDRTDSELVLKILKQLGMDRVMVESPSYCHSMLQDGLLDEWTVNYSCVYIGGNAVGFGQGMEACTSTRHPHSELLSIHMHSPSFMYLRHKFIYNY